VWQSEASRKVLRAVAWMAPTAETVLLTGASGTGKSFVAEIIHRLSERADEAFCVIPIAGLSPTLVHSELFGHEAHAFTDAGRKRRTGLIEDARGGTVFLDEIGDIHALTQVMLLRLLQDHRFRRLGGNLEIQSDVRILAATNHELRERVDRGEFREDLYFRMGTFTIEMPGLAERREDIPAMAETFLSRLASGSGGAYRALRFSRAALKRLGEHDWPGNIRELEKAVVWGFYHAGRREVIDVDDLPLDRSGAGSRGFLAQGDGAPGDFSAERFEHCYLEAVLKLCKWNVSQAARVLGLKPDTVRDRMRRAGLRRPTAPRP
jgi:DNA-binding NtrC family response regulator